MPAHKHHKVRRKNLTRDKEKKPYLVHACILPGCHFYMACHLMLGKEVICNRCDKPFIMDARSIVESKPHCKDCTKKRRTTVIKDVALEDFMSKLGLD